jgi:hypothetical protein
MKLIKKQGQLQFIIHQLELEGTRRDEFMRDRIVGALTGAYGDLDKLVFFAVNPGSLVPNTGRVLVAQNDPNDPYRTIIDYLTNGPRWSMYPSGAGFFGVRGHIEAYRSDQLIGLGPVGFLFKDQPDAYIPHNEKETYHKCKKRLFQKPVIKIKIVHKFDKGARKGRDFSLFPLE